LPLGSCFFRCRFLNGCLLCSSPLCWSFLRFCAGAFFAGAFFALDFPATDFFSGTFSATAPFVALPPSSLADAVFTGAGFTAFFLFFAASRMLFSSTTIVI
jgi:hypothetical protein